MVTLKQLSLEDDADIYSMLQEIPAEENGFYNEANRLTSDKYTAWLKQQINICKGINLPDWMVPQTTFWLYCNSVPVGMGRIRHYLNDKLKIDGGHIGYAIAPSHRGLGYGNELLKLLLHECDKLNIKEVHIGANKNNERSNKIIILNGGVLHRTNEHKNFYIIAL